MKFTYLLTAFILVALAATGQTFKWIRGGGSSTTGTEQVTHICADPTGNSYAASVVGGTTVRADSFYKAQLHNPTSPGILLTSYDCNGSMRWAKVIEPANCYGLKYDKGNIYVAGTFRNTGSGQNRYIGNTQITGNDLQCLFLAKLDSMGNLAWIKFVGWNPAVQTTSCAPFGALALDPQGNIHHFANIYAAGLQLSPTVTSVQGTYDMVYDASGNLLRAVLMNLPGGLFLQDQGTSPYKNTAVAISGSGKIFAVSYKGIFQPQSTRLCAFSPTGTLLWEDSAAWATAPHRSVVWDVAYDNNNGIYVSGSGTNGEFSFQGAPTILNTVFPKFGNLSVIVKVDTNGDTKWVYANQHNVNTGQLECTAILPNGNIIAAGFTKGPVSNGLTILASMGGTQNAYYTIVDTTGKLVKMDVLYGNYNEYFSAMTTDRFGNVYFGGYTSDTVKIPGGNYYKNAGGSSDFFITKMGFNCGCSTTISAAFTNSAPTGKNVSYTYSGTVPTLDSLIWNFGDGQKLKVTAGFTTPVSHTHIGNGPFSVCVTAYSGCGISTACKLAPLGLPHSTSLTGVKVYPNPVKDYLRIEGAASATAILSNAIGQQMFSRSTIGENEHIFTGDLPPGIYTLTLIGRDGTRNNTQVVKL